MSTLADSFLNDLDELSSGDEEPKQTAADAPQKDPSAPPTSISNEAAHDLDDLSGDEMDIDAGQPAESKASAASGAAAEMEEMRARIFSLRRSQKFADVTGAVRNAASGEFAAHGDEFYALVMRCNELIFALDEKVLEIYRAITDVYSLKFPELATLVKDPVEYARTVAMIGNEMDMTLVDLQSILPSALVMSVSVTSSTTNGKPLSAEQLRLVQDACAEVIALDKLKKETLLKFVSDRISSISPNVSAIVGTSIAAILLGIAGGLEALAQIPSGNVLLLGKSDNALSGFSRVSAMRNTGVIYHCALVQNCMPKYRRKALRVVAGRLALAARVDLTRAAPDGAQGKVWYDEIQQKTEKWAEPPPGKTKQALPDPEPKKKRRRAGRRIRKRKEMMEQTEMHKQASRMRFVENKTDEYGDASMGLSFGMLGEEGGGKLRVVANKRKHEAKLPKYLQKQQQHNETRAQLRAINAGSSGATSGLASSIAFTPVQGIELVNPDAQKEKIKQLNLKYFGKGYKAKNDK